MKTVTIKVTRKFSEIHTCSCGIKFIEIEEELRMGYRRECCPFCVAYKHSGKSPQLTHNWTPFNNVIEDDILCLV